MFINIAAYDLEKSFMFSSVIPCLHGGWVTSSGVYVMGRGLLMVDRVFVIHVALKRWNASLMN